MAPKIAFSPQSFLGQQILDRAKQITKRVVALSGAAFAGLLALALKLGKGALVGLGIGATGGLVAGAVLGFKAGLAFGLATAPLFGPFAVITVPAFAALGTIGGAAIGIVAGSGIGLVVGYYAEKIWSGIATGAKSALTSFGTAANSFLSGLWSGATSAVGGFFSGASSFFVSLTSLSIPTAAIAVPLFTAIGAVTVGSVVVSVVTNSTFFTPQIDAAGNIPTENQYARIAKTASPTNITSDDAKAGKDVNYTITLTAKTFTLNNVTISNNTIVSPIGAPEFTDFTTDKDSNDITIFNIGTMDPGTTKTITYTILVQGDKYVNSTIADTAKANFMVLDKPSSVNDRVAVTVGGIPPSCGSFEDNTPHPTTPDELINYIYCVASGKTEPISLLPLEVVMRDVMIAESVGGNQCAVGTAAEIGVFQYTAGTWRGGSYKVLGMDSGSGTLANWRLRTQCWGIPGEDPTPIPPYDTDPWFCWPCKFGGTGNIDGNAWNPFRQIDNTVLVMLAGGGCWNWTTMNGVLKKYGKSCP